MGRRHWATEMPSRTRVYRREDTPAYAFEKSSLAAEPRAGQTSALGVPAGAGEGWGGLEKDRLLTESLPIVRFVAKRIHDRLPNHIDIEDLIGAGILGLIDAVQKYDVRKNVLFRSYAQIRIRGAILDSLRETDWGSREIRRQGRLIQDAIGNLSKRLSRPPTESEVAVEIGESLESYQQLLGELKGLEIGTLHAERSEDSDEEELAYLPGSPEDDPLHLFLREETHEHLAIAIEQLPEQERLVLTLYYYEELTMKEIGMTLRVVESRVSQIRSSAILHMRALLESASGAFPAGNAKPNPRTSNLQTSDEQISRRLA